MGVLAWSKGKAVSCSAWFEAGLLPEPSQSPASESRGQSWQTILLAKEARRVDSGFGLFGAMCLSR